MNPDQNDSLPAGGEPAVPPLQNNEPQVIRPSGQPAAPAAPATGPSPNPSIPPPQSGGQPATITTSPVPPAPQAVDTTALFQPDTPGSNPFSSGSAGRRRKLLLGGAAALAVLLIGFGWLFALYLPNRPGAVWNTGLDRSGKALDELVIQASDKKQLEAFKKSEINASLDIKTGSGNFSGSLTGRFDESKADGKLSVSVKEAGGQTQTVDMNFLSELAEGAVYPDFYMQFHGFKALGADLLVPGIGQYEDKWIVADAKTLESYGVEPLQKKKDGASSIDSNDVSELTRTLSSLNKDYVMNADEHKSIIRKKDFIGKEKTDGITAYHYTAGLNKENAKQFCQAFADRITSTNVYKKLTADDQSIDAGLFFFKPDEKEDSVKECQKSVDETKDSDTFDIWIDGKYKLIHKVRFIDEKDADTYTEIGQTYKGGDDISLFLAFHEGKEKTDAKFTLETNVKTIDSKGSFHITGGEGSDKYEGNVSFSIKPLSGDVNIQKPKDAVPIQEILQKFGYGPSATGPADDFFAGQQGQAKDAERKSDINALYSQVEVYFAMNGYYPTLNQLNDSSWRSANLRGLTDDAVTPPDSSSGKLAVSATAGQYGYSASGCNAQGCTGFVLAAQLSNGQKFSKTGSNN